MVAKTGNSKSPEAVIRVRIIPRASRNMIVGKEGDFLKIKVTAPPLEGKANRALVALLAGELGVAKGKVEIVSGMRSREKRVRICGLSHEEVDEMLEKGR